MQENHDPEIQRKIRLLIEKHPGIYLSKLAEMMQINITNLESHLLQMEHTKTITVLQQEGYKRYYLQNQIGTVNGSGEKTYERIYNLIAQTPGLHLSKIAEMLTMSKPLANYHLLRMEKNNQITVMQEKGYKRYYVASDSINIHDKELLSLLRKELPLKIVLFLARRSPTRYTDILGSLDAAPSTLSYHLDQLIKKGIITQQRYGEEKGYSLCNRKDILAVILRYRLHVIVDGFNDLWDDLNYTPW